MGAKDGDVKPTPLRSNRSFQLLWTGQAVSVVGSRMSAIAYPLLVLAMTGSPASAGLVGFLGTVPYVLFQLPAGILVDRVNRRRLMVICDAGRTLALSSIPIAVLFGGLTLVQVAAAAFVEGSLFVIFRLCEMSAVRILVRPDQYSQALAQNEARLRAASLIGTPLGGLLFGVGRSLPFVADALTYLISLATLLLIRVPFEEKRTAEHRDPIEELREGVRWLRGQPYILLVNFAASASNALFQIVILVVIVASEHRGASASQVGLVLAGFGLGGFAGSLIGGWLSRHVGPNRIVLITIWSWPITGLVGILESQAALTVLLAMLAFMGAAWNVATSTIYYQLVPDRLIGRVSSVGSLTAFGALPLGALAGGVLVQALGPASAGLLAGGGMLLLAILTTTSRAIREGPNRPAADHQGA